MKNQGNYLLPSILFLMVSVQRANSKPWEKLKFVSWGSPMASSCCKAVSICCIQITVGCECFINSNDLPNGSFSSVTSLQWYEKLGLEVKVERVGFSLGFIQFS